MKPKCFQCPAWSKKMGDFACVKAGYSYQCDYCWYAKGLKIGRAFDTFIKSLEDAGINRESIKEQMLAMADKQDLTGRR